MEFRHEKLEVWQLAIKLVKIVYEILKKFPEEEKFGLIAQIRNAVISIVLNISEGSGRRTPKDFANFIRNAISSLLEVDTGLKVGILLRYITSEDYKKADSVIEKLYFKLIGLDKSLKNEVRLMERLERSEADRTIRKSKSKGFTLIEILIASFIFVVTIGAITVIFTSSSNVQSQTRVIRDTTQSARYALEAISREIKLAQSEYDPISGNLIKPAFEINPAVCGSCLLVHSEEGDKQYSLTNGVIYLNNPSNPLTNPDEVKVTTLTFSGRQPANGLKQQPYLTITMTIESADSTEGKVAEKASQTIKTTVTSRSYPFGLSP